MGFGLPLEKIVNDKRFIEKVYDEYIDEIIDVFGVSKTNLCNNLKNSNSNFFKFAIFALGAFKSSFK